MRRSLHLSMCTRGTKRIPGVSQQPAETYTARQKFTQAIATSTTHAKLHTTNCSMQAQPGWKGSESAGHAGATHAAREFKPWPEQLTSVTLKRAFRFKLGWSLNRRGERVQRRDRGYGGSATAKQNSDSSLMASKKIWYCCGSKPKTKRYDAARPGRPYLRSCDHVCIAVATLGSIRLVTSRRATCAQTAATKPYNANPAPSRKYPRLSYTCTVSSATQLRVLTLFQEKTAEAELTEQRWLLQVGRVTSLICLFRAG